jgi:hypothetical protein
MYQFYRVVLLSNDEYRKTLYKSRTKKSTFKKYHQLIEENKKIKFPKKFINTDKIKPVYFRICVTKVTEENDMFRTIRDNLGRTKIEDPLVDWTILASHFYDVEEEFWIFGNDAKANRPTVEAVFSKLLENHVNSKNNRQVVVVHNKLVVYNEEKFDMVVCKNIRDAQRLHHYIYKIFKKNKVKGFVFMGTASQATISQLYVVIKNNTDWTIQKIRKTTTRP